MPQTQPSERKMFDRYDQQVTQIGGLLNHLDIVVADLFGPTPPSSENKVAERPPGRAWELEDRLAYTVARLEYLVKMFSGLTPIPTEAAVSESKTLR